MFLHNAPLPHHLPGWLGGPAPVGGHAAGITSEPNINLHWQSTPVKSTNLASKSAYTSAQFKATEVRKTLAGELVDAVFDNIPMVWDRYLGPSSDVPSSPVVEPPSYSDVEFVAWLVSSLNTYAFTIGPASQYCWLNTQNKFIKSVLSTSRAPDFCLVPSWISTPEGITWASIRVVGEHQSAGNSKTTCILQLADYVSQVFAHQVARIFVHAILTLKPTKTSAGEVMLLVFDRAGVVASTTRPLGAKLPDIAAGYQYMSRTRLGYDEQGLKTNDNGEHLWVELADGRKWAVKDTLCRRPGIITRGTYCAVAMPEPGFDNTAVVIKLSWRAASRPSEGELLKIAAKCKVICVARYVHHCDIGDIFELSRGDIQATGPAVHFLPGSAKSGTTKAKLQSSGTEKRKSGPRAAPKFTTTKSTASGNRDLPFKPENLEVTLGSMDLTDDISPYQARLYMLNRMYNLVITTPVGTPIMKCINATQVAQTLLGALVGHASLFFAGKILHRDISINNIMHTSTPFPLTDDQLAVNADILPASKQLQGFLIDLDYAVQHPPTAVSGAPHRTGTLPFMSINVLSDKPHGYRDDLESFLYVLIWTCITDENGLVDPDSKLRFWNEGELYQIAASKSFAMTNKDRFEDLLCEFEPQYAGLETLAERWRKVLFAEGASKASDRGLFVQMRDACWEQLQALGEVKKQ